MGSGMFGRLPKAERNAVAVARYIRRTRPRTINARDLRRDSSLPMLKVADDVDQALEALAEAGWLRGASQRDGTTPGRGRKDYQVNPAVLAS